MEAPLGELGLDVVPGLGAVLAGVGSTGEAARVHDGGRSGCPPGVVLRGKYRVFHLFDRFTYHICCDSAAV